MNREMRRHPTHPFLPILPVSKNRILDKKRGKKNSEVKSNKQTYNNRRII